MTGAKVSCTACNTEFITLNGGNLNTCPDCGHNIFALINPIDVPDGCLVIDDAIEEEIPNDMPEV